MPDWPSGGSSGRDPQRVGAYGGCGLFSGPRDELRRAPAGVPVYTRGEVGGRGRRRQVSSALTTDLLAATGGEPASLKLGERARVQAPLSSAPVEGRWPLPRARRDPDPVFGRRPFGRASLHLRGPECRDAQDCWLGGDYGPERLFSRGGWRGFPRGHIGSISNTSPTSRSR